MTHVIEPRPVDPSTGRCITPFTPFRGQAQPFAIPYEYPETKKHTSQNNKHILTHFGNLVARVEAIERFLAHEIGLDLDCLCELICECPPCDFKPPDEILVPFDGKPYENIYADTLNYIGNIDSTAGVAPVCYRIFNPLNGDEVAQFLDTDGDGARWESAQGQGAAWHHARNEVWIAGYLDGGTTASVRVYDAGKMASTRDPAQAFKVQYDYTGFSYGPTGDGQKAIEVCPLTGHVYLGLYAGGGASTFAVVNPADGAILHTGRAATTSGWSFEDQPTLSFVWHAGLQVMIALQLRDEFFTIAVDDFATSQLSGNIGGLIDTGSGIHQAAYGGNGYVYMVPSKYANCFRFADPESLIPNNGSGGPACPTFKSGLEVDGAGGGSFVSSIPEHGLVILSRGNDSLVFSDPDNAGIVDVIEAGDPLAVVARFQPSFNPARTAYCYNAGNVSVVPWWNQDTEWFVQFFPLAGSGGPIGPDPGPGDDPTPPPEEDPGGEEEPPPEGEGEPPPSTTPPPGGTGPIPPGWQDAVDQSGTHPPTTVLFDYGCVYQPDNDRREPGATTWSGTVISIARMTVTNTFGDTGEDNPFRNTIKYLYLFPKGADPDTDPYFRYWQAIGGDIEVVLGRVFYIQPSAYGLKEKPPCQTGSITVEYDVYSRAEYRKDGRVVAFSAWAEVLPLKSRLAADGDGWSTYYANVLKPGNPYP